MSVNWEAIGAIGEILGAGGVIVTLVFLAFQVRQNSRLLLNQTRQLEQNHKMAIAEALGDSNAQENAMLAIAQDEGLSEIIYNGIRDYEALSALERMRFGLAMGPLIAAVASQFEKQEELGITESNLAADHLVFVLDFLSTAGGRQWWRRYRNRYPPRFCAQIDRELSTSGG